MKYRKWNIARYFWQSSCHGKGRLIVTESMCKYLQDRQNDLIDSYIHSTTCYILAWFFRTIDWNKNCREIKSWKIYQRSFLHAASAVKWLTGHSFSNQTDRKMCLYDRDLLWLRENFRKFRWLIRLEYASW